MPTNKGAVAEGIGWYPKNTLIEANVHKLKPIKDSSILNVLFIQLILNYNLLSYFFLLFVTDNEP